MKYICDIEDIDDAKCVELSGQHFYLVRDHESIRMFSLICPHQGGIVAPQGKLLVCPVHKWKFDARSGESVVGSKGLTDIPVQLVDGKVIAEVGEEGSVEKRSSRGKHPVDVKLVAHACMEIRFKRFTLVTDPWLDGPAFHGAWAQYPPPFSEPRDLRADAILITHEHSDHYHENTLRQLDRSIPIYFPAFPNRRLDKFLAELGFLNLHPMTFGKKYPVNRDFNITCYNPTSNWNDSIQLIDVNGWRLLNLNDAGVNFRIAKLVAPIDLIASSFGSGASAYPMCWTHLTGQEAEKILHDQFTAKKDMLIHASEIYRCRKILPCASYFVLQHPRHRHYQELLSKYKITPFEIRDQLALKGIEVLDLLPGESYSAQTGKILRRGYDPELFSWESTAAWIDENFQPERFAALQPSGYVYDEAEVTAYFLSLRHRPEIQYVKQYDFTVEVTGDNRRHTLAFRIENQDIECIDPATATNLTIEVPLQLLMHLIRHNRSWDELYIGYWCKLHNENPYNVAFWRLLQAPYFLTMGSPQEPAAALESTQDIPLSALLENHAEICGRILSRHGMYCVGCERSPMETLAEGARKHGLSPQEIEDLVGELNRALLLGQRK